MSFDDEIKAHPGLIGYFDILGYQRLLEINSAEYVANKVMRVLHSLNEDIRQWQQRRLFDEMHLNERSKEPLANAIGTIKVLVISDTILVTLETDTGENCDKFTFWYIFAMHCARLWEKMFTDGLALRGAITHGEFVVRESCWAGKPIVDAYRQAECLDFAGCVIADDAKSWIEAALGIMELQNEFMYAAYSVPVNDGTFRPGTVFNINWHRVASELEIGDVRQSVHESFWAHGKEVSGTVLHKADNTERYLRFLDYLRTGKTTPFKKKP